MRALKLLETAEREAMTEEERAAADAVVDLDADSATCPACTGAIPRGRGRCPSCGLRLF